MLNYPDTNTATTADVDAILRRLSHKPGIDYDAARKARKLLGEMDGGWGETRLTAANVARMLYDLTKTGRVA